MSAVTILLANAVTAIHTHQLCSMFGDYMNNVKNMFLYVLLAAIHFECPQVRPVGVDFVWAMGRDTMKALDVLRQKFWTSDFISWIPDYCSTVTCVCCLVCSCLASPHLQLMLVSHLSLGIVPWNLGNASQPAARNVTVRNTAGPVFHSVRCKF